MTTIAFANGIIAFDTQVTQYDSRRSTILKVVRRGKYIIGGEGCLIMQQKFWRYFKDIKKGHDWINDPALPYVSEDDSVIFVIGPDHSRYEIHQAGVYEDLVAPFWAYGSGSPYALGAMACGASAHEAVEIACRFDVYSSSPISQITLPPRQSHHGA